VVAVVVMVLQLAPKVPEAPQQAGLIRPAMVGVESLQLGAVRQMEGPMCLIIRRVLLRVVAVVVALSSLFLMSLEKVVLLVAPDLHILKESLGAFYQAPV
jgi:hypothetical protein